MKIFLDKKKINSYVRNYNNSGYIHIKSFFDKKTIEIIKKELKNYINTFSKKLEKREINYIEGSKKINSLHNIKKSKTINELKKNKKILNIASLFVGEKCKEFGAEFFAKPKKVGLASPVHQDNYYWNITKDNGLTFWIALESSNKKNGGIFYYSGSHKIGIKPHVSSFVPGSSQTLKNTKILKFFKKKTPSLKKGDILIHHSAVIHGSNKNNSEKSRMGLTLRFIPKKSKINYFLKKKYESKLKKQILI